MTRMWFGTNSTSRPFTALLTVLLLTSTAMAQELRFQLAEESAPALLGNVAVLANLTSVLGQSDLSNLQYAIVDDSGGDSPFFVDQKSGDLSTKTTLDRESMCGTAEVCVVQGAVAVQSSSPMSAFFRKFTVILRVLDINDHSPVFSQESFVVNIPENAVTDTVFVLPSATDQDADLQNKVQRYALEPSYQHFQLHVARSKDALGDIQFLVNLKVVRSLDRETRQLFSTSLVAFDNGNPPRSASLPLSINVVDTNDNAPQFDQLEYSKTLTEGVPKDSIVLMVSARDSDEGDNARVSYFLADWIDQEIKKMFAVNQDTGIVIVKSELANCGGKTFQFEVVAQDNGVPVKNSVCRVVIKVLDTRNDRPVVEVSPLFGEQRVAIVPETAAMGRVVSLLTVMDNDFGRNGIVSCRLNSAFFSLQKLELNEYKLIVAHPLDREKKANHTIIIRCTDSGSPPLSTESTLYVQVTDSNDNSPTFTNDRYALSVLENEVKGTWVGQVTAQDMDTDENARIVYDMEKNGDPFTIDTVLGDIYTTQFLDREAKPQYVLRVYAYDNSVSPLTASATVIVNVADKNDLQPVFTAASYTFHLQENAPLGTLVGQVKATDGDLGLNARLEYYMVTSQSRPEIPVGVNSSGAVLVTSVVDYETSNIYSFTIVAMDMGSPRQNSTSLVTVEVMDNNDHNPVITFPSPDNPSVSIPLDTAPGSEIAKVVAYDLDTGANGRLHYSISVANSSALFNIDYVTGIITLGNQILSRDVRSYNIVVTVSDTGVPQMAQRALLQIDITSPYEPQQGSSTNLKLVIALVSLTLLLALAVLTPLLFIYCFNRQRPVSEKHRHKVLTRPGYQPERLEKITSDPGASVFTSERDDTAIYSSQWESKLRRESDSMQNYHGSVSTDIENGSHSNIDKHYNKDVDDMNAADLTPSSRNDTMLSASRDLSGKVGDVAVSNRRWNMTLLRENLAALHSPKKADMAYYSCEGGSNPRYECLQAKSKKSVNFEDERHPSIMEEEGDICKQEVKSVQVVEDPSSSSHFSTFKPPHRSGAHEDQQVLGNRQNMVDPVRVALRQHNVHLKALKNNRPSPQQQVSV